jgi:nitroimidazol reductase NimA-like FMN-containing flavoprotein (pyridoxamine 5'-phosphate oxidase superfamily)
LLLRLHHRHDATQEAGGKEKWHVPCWSEFPKLDERISPMPTLENLSPEFLESLTAGVRFVSLATLSENGPVVRSIGSWAIRGATLYFSTSRGSSKVAQLARDPRVSIQLLAEGQELPKLRNLVVNGAAKPLEGDERTVAIEALGSRNPRFRERADKGQLGDTAIYAVTATQAKVLDFSRGVGPVALTVFEGSAGASTTAA